MKCLLCNSNHFAFKFSYKGNDIYLKNTNVKDFDLDWFECECCGVFFSKQYDNIEKVYDDENLYDSQYDKNSIKDRFNDIMNLNDKNSDNALRVRRVKSFHNRYITYFKINQQYFKILDIGAGLGVFLARFLERKFRGAAIEVNKVAANHLKELLDIKVYQKKVQNLKNCMNFDLITMNRVIEHIKDPIDVLKHVHKILKKKGIIYIELPDVLSYHLYGNKSNAFSSGHFMVYNPKSLYWLLETCSFEVLLMDRIIEPSGKYTIFSFAKKVGT